MLDPDADARRYKDVHGEITRLRREIELKRRSLLRLNHTAAQPTYQPKTERVRWSQSRLVISLANLFEKSDSTDESVTNDYIIDHENRTLMTPRAMKRHQAKVQQMRAENARKRAILRAEWDAQEWTEFKNWNLAETEACDRVLIDGNAYGVKHDGTRLLPIDGLKRKEGEIVFWNGWTFLASKSGLLWRTTQTPPKIYCRYFTRSGRCSHGNGCKFVHDMSRLALCRHFLAGRCAGECLFSHEASEFNTPVCRYHLQDRCLSKECKFLHKLPPKARQRDVEIMTCRPFALNGWCDRGQLCPFTHLYNCPDYEEAGSCPRGTGCTLTHSVTKRVQQMIAEPTEENNVVIPRDATDLMEETTVVSSYTVDPKILFVRLGQVKFLIDRPDGEMIIDLSLSEGEEDEDLDAQEIKGSNYVSSQS